MKTFPTDNSKFLTIDCPFCYKGKVEIVEKLCKVSGIRQFKTIGVKNCPICNGKRYLLLTKHE
jgi:hypothetical protein